MKDIAQRLLAILVSLQVPALALADVYPRESADWRAFSRDPVNNYAHPQAYMEKEGSVILKVCISKSAARPSPGYDPTQSISDGTGWWPSQNTTPPVPEVCHLAAPVIVPSSEAVFKLVQDYVLFNLRQVIKAMNERSDALTDTLKGLTAQDLGESMRQQIKAEVHAAMTSGAEYEELRDRLIQDVLAATAKRDVRNPR